MSSGWSVFELLLLFYPNLTLLSLPNTSEVLYSNFHKNDTQKNILKVNKNIFLPKKCFWKDGIRKLDPLGFDVLGKIVLLRFWSPLIFLNQPKLFCGFVRLCVHWRRPTYATFTTSAAYSKSILIPQSSSRQFLSSLFFSICLFQLLSVLYFYKVVFFSICFLLFCVYVFVFFYYHLSIL